jgi:hypothetical protein
MKAIYKLSLINWSLEISKLLKYFDGILLYVSDGNETTRSQLF